MATQPDYNKEKFKVTITVCEDCQKIDVQSLDGKEITYQELIGALEIMKQRYIFNQTVVNIEEYQKWRQSQDNTAKKQTQ